MTELLSILSAYLLGSFPTAYIAGRIFRGIDIRKFGSGNVGATNAFRVLGKSAGILVLVIDILKGLAATTVLADFFLPFSGVAPLIHRIIISIAVVAGHNWTVFLKFKGGKGVACGFGALLGLSFRISQLNWIIPLIVASWLVTFLLSGFISLASLTAAVVLPFLLLVFTSSLPLFVSSLVLSVFVVYRHKANISRLLAKTEPRVKIFSFFRKK